MDGRMLFLLKNLGVSLKKPMLFLARSTTRNSSIQHSTPTSFHLLFRCTQLAGAGLKGAMELLVLPLLLLVCTYEQY